MIFSAMFSRISPRFTKYSCNRLSPFPATHPENAPVTPFLATHPKLVVCKSFACDTSEKIGGVPPAAQPSVRISLSRAKLLAADAGAIIHLQVRERVSARTSGCGTRVTGDRHGFAR